VPVNVPVPHVESTLTFDYTVDGQFVKPFINGRAEFLSSEFLGGLIGEGTIGSIDTAAQPIRYTGDGEVTGIDLGRLGRGLEVAWLQDPRYDGTISGHFQVEGTGSDRQTLTLTSIGRISHANLFSGTITDSPQGEKVPVAPISSAATPSAISRADISTAPACRSTGRRRPCGRRSSNPSAPRHR
jgi:hypothetical protein